MSSKARYIMIGGFLGAGKSTSILKLATWFKNQDKKVGLITNDQGAELVDTAFLKSNGFSVKEIAGGCFCCRFNSLADAATSLKEETKPDVFIAEPVGSCTDLIATVSYPLRRIYGEEYGIAPLSVVVDPIRAARILGIEEGPRFSEKVRYIYRKQLEEAAIIMINKCDLISPEKLETLHHKITETFPEARIYHCSARKDTGLEPWFKMIAGAEVTQGNPLDIDYKTYGEGEAALGWLNATVEARSSTPWDGNQATVQLAAKMCEVLRREGAVIAHLKMTLSPEVNLYGDLAVVNAVDESVQPELGQSLPDPLENGQLILNIRAEARPEVLRDAVQAAVRECSGQTDFPSLQIDHLEFFKPGQPEPVHRDQKL